MRAEAVEHRLPLEDGEDHVFRVAHVYPQQRQRAVVELDKEPPNLERGSQLPPEQAASVREEQGAATLCCAYYFTFIETTRADPRLVCSDRRMGLTTPSDTLLCYMQKRATKKQKG